MNENMPTVDQATSSVFRPTDLQSKMDVLLHVRNSLTEAINAGLSSESLSAIASAAAVVEKEVVEWYSPGSEGRSKMKIRFPNP